MTQVANPTPEQVEKAARFFDHIQKAREAGKGWWAVALERMVTERVEEDNLKSVMLDALNEARVQVSILQDRLGIVDPGCGTLSIIDAALTRARGRP